MSPNTHQPLISVISVCYNEGSNMIKTLESVKQQNYSPIEHIVIDGGSTDATMNIINKYEFENKQVVSEPDNGLYDAMNKGLDLANGEYVTFLNGGDRFYSPLSLKNALELCNNADFIYSNAIRLGGDDKEKPWHKKTPNPSELSYKSFINGMVINHQCMIVKRSIVPKYDLQWTVSGDIDWSIRILKKTHSFYQSPMPIAYFSEGGVSSTRKWEAVKQRFFICVDHFGWLLSIIQQFIILMSLLRTDKRQLR